MDKFFKISERGSNVRTEIIAGLTTFFAMAYIVITNPNQITSFSTDGPLGQIWNAVYVASILVAIIGTLLMALYARMPFAQACGMGLNSFFFVSFILPALISGGDLIEGYQAGLVIILVSGIVFLVFSLTGLRSKVAKALPDCLKKAIPAGIGWPDRNCCVGDVPGQGFCSDQHCRHYRCLLHCHRNVPSFA